MATPPNVVSTTMTDADLATALKHYDDLEALLSFLLALTRDQRQKLIKFGTASLGFVNGCLELVKLDSSFLPASVSVAEFQKDVTLLNQLVTLQTRHNSYALKLQDTYRQVSGEAYKAALVVYKSAREYGGPEIQPTVDQLGMKFQTAQTEQSGDKAATTEPA